MAAKKVVHGRKATVGWEGPWCMGYGSPLPAGLTYWTGAVDQKVTCAACLGVQRKSRGAKGALKSSKRGTK